MTTYMHEKKFYRTIKRFEPVVEKYRQEYYAAGRRFHEAENMIGKIYITYICKSCGNVEHLSYSSAKSETGKKYIAAHLCQSCAKEVSEVKVFNDRVITQFTRADGRVEYEFYIDGKVHRL